MRLSLHPWRLGNDDKERREGGASEAIDQTSRMCWASGPPGLPTTAHEIPKCVCVHCTKEWKVLVVTQWCPTETLWIVAPQAPLTMEFPRQEYWSGLPFPSPGYLPTQGSNPVFPRCRQILHHLSQQRSPCTMEAEAKCRGSVASFPFGIPRAAPA